MRRLRELLLIRKAIVMLLEVSWKKKECQYCCNGRTDEAQDRPSEWLRSRL